MNYFVFECLMTHSSEAVNIVTPMAKRIVWYYHSENRIKTQFCSEIRLDLWSRYLESQYENVSLNVQKSQEIGMDAPTILELID